MSIRWITWLLPHLLAGALAMFYAWHVAQTSLRTTGLQFVSPLFVIVMVHLIWAVLRGPLQPGFAAPLFQKAAGSALLLLAFMGIGTVFAPQPAHADVGEAVEMILIVFVCAAMIAAVVGIAGLVLHLVIKFVMFLFGRDNDGPKTRLFDEATLALGLGVLIIASLEGLPSAYRFGGEDQGRATHLTTQPPAKVWATMQVATSPSFPLPSILAPLPKPVAVTTDEGTRLGANRVVRFEGREGAGHLHLRVTAQDNEAATFTVLNDTTPYAGWIGYKTLTYRVIPTADGGSQVSVVLDFERKLAPAWFFGPVMRGAAHLAADVLVRDVIARAEG